MIQGDPRDLRRYMELSQIGLEMVAPIGLGLVLDYYTGWMPWATVTCCVLGFVGGMLHLVALTRKQDEGKRRPPGGAT
jgi:F0F1-type ATP synthase assembly protein I